MDVEGYIYIYTGCVLKVGVSWQHVFAPVVESLVQRCSCCCVMLPNAGQHVLSEMDARPHLRFPWQDFDQDDSTCRKG